MLLVTDEILDFEQPTAGWKYNMAQYFSISTTEKCLVVPQWLTDFTCAQNSLTEIHEPDLVSGPEISAWVD